MDDFSESVLADVRVIAAIDEAWVTGKAVALPRETPARCLQSEVRRASLEDR